MPSRGGDNPAFDTSAAHIARVYDYWLGGKDNYEADRRAGDAAIEVYPDIVRSVKANRAFLARVVRYLARDAGIRQFLDIGTGIPTANNTHEVAQSAVPSSRVVYVDNDPVVLAHARALLTGGPEGATDYIDADLRDTGTILDHARQTLDFARPVAVMLIAILHVIGDEDRPADIVARLLDAVPPGSYLAMSHVASDIVPGPAAEMVRRLNLSVQEKTNPRTQAAVTRYFDGLELIEPGVVRVQHWRPDSELESATPSNMWGGVGRKP
ncbi:MAG TPA: SAM-dependent methyltransferase [Streptosporangiaceae bacterium]|nr:SAM-dependent methyltransferase [Streptosporangiaceae bacterium]